MADGYARQYGGGGGGHGVHGAHGHGGVAGGVGSGVAGGPHSAYAARVSAMAVGGGGHDAFIPGSVGGAGAAAEAAALHSLLASPRHPGGSTLAFANAGAPGAYPPTPGSGVIGGPGYGVLGGGMPGGGGVMGGGGVSGGASGGAGSPGSPEGYGRGSPAREKRRHRGHDSDAGDVAKNFKVVIRVRPPLARELHGDRPFANVVKVEEAKRQITISENLNEGDEDAAVGPYSAHTFTFDHVFDQDCDQRKVFEDSAKAVVESSLQGYNATIFAYGQTGTGKTYTMEGFNSTAERGILPRAIEQIFRHIQSTVSPRMRFLVRASYLQIYNEVISDLLKPDRTNLVIREDKKKGVFVEGLSEWVVRSPQEIYGLMERGGAQRATGSTKMNELSSRSHAVFVIIAEQSETTYLDNEGKEMSTEEFHKLVKSRAHGDAGLKALEANVRQSFKVGKLNLVDLAGSERVRLTGATGQRLEESKKINQSLSALGNVIAALTDPRGRQHIPYRDSKLTRILEDSLGGNCKTTMMAMISPALEAFTESLSTLKFANRAKNIKNEARINEDVDQKSLLRRYERELKRLRAELEERSRNVVDKRKVLELEEQKRRAEEDKMAAIRELEARSRAFMREKAEKRKLEQRISMLQGQVLIGGTPKNMQDTPAFRAALREHQEALRKEYEDRMQRLERERESIEEEKAQVDRYKQLLLKQRDIMIMLTQRLNERDEQIMALQDELDAYDRHQKDLEEKLDAKTAALIHLQRVTMEHAAASPVKNDELEEALGAQWGDESDDDKADGAAGGASGRGLRGGGVPSGSSQRGRSSTPVDRKMLVTTKQYPPHDAAPVVFSSEGFRARSGSTGADSAGEGQLLSAEDKISELTSLLSTATREQERLSKEIEEVRSEKVSTEYLLREKLEKIVQSEIETRLAGFRASEQEAANAELERLRSELEKSSVTLAKARGDVKKLESENASMRERLEAAESGGTAVSAAEPPTRASDEAKELREALARSQAESEAFRTDVVARLEEKNGLVNRLQDENSRLRKLASEADMKRAAQERQLEEVRAQAAAVRSSGADRAQAMLLTSLEEKCNTHSKERRALNTILEHKIKTLVDAIAGVAASVSPGVPLPLETPRRLSREVQALQRLVNASIAALKHSEVELAAKDEETAKRMAVYRSEQKVAAVSTGRGSGSVAGPSPSASRSAARPASSTAGAMSVEEMIHQRKLQLQSGSSR